jgi:hypothetical protein
MQLGFDFLYDEEVEKLCTFLGIAKYANFFTLLPEIILCIDSLLKLTTGIYENGVIVEDKKIIVEHYLKHGLIFDLIAYLPVVIQSFWKMYFAQFNPVWIKTMQLMMFCKLKRISIALSNFEEIVSSKGKTDYMLSGARLLLNVFFISHLNACAWHALAYFNPNDNEMTWLKFSGYESSTWPNRYCVSLYFSVSVFVNTGIDSKFAPQNSLEYLYMIFVLLVSVGLFGYVIMTIREILELKKKKTKEYK